MAISDISFLREYTALCMSHRRFEITLLVEFEDLDAGGVVYHANYLRLCDRVRSRFFDNAGFDFASLKTRDLAMTVRNFEADYKIFMLGGEFRCVLHVEKVSERSFQVLHEFFQMRDSKELLVFVGRATLVTVNYSTAKSCALPKDLREFL